MVSCGILNAACWFVRINFDGSYTDIQRALKAYSSKENLGSLFSENLQDVKETSKSSPVKFTPVELPKKIEVPPPSLEMKPLERAQVNLDAFPLSAPKVIHTRRISDSEIKRQENFTPDQKKEYFKELIAEAGKKHGVDPALGMAVAKAESNFNHKAVSQDGFASKGLFQLLDSTGKTLLERNSQDTENYDPFNPETNVDLGVGYLRYLHEAFSKPTSLGNNLSTVPGSNSSEVEKFAVAAFNAGEGRIAFAQSEAKKRGKDPSTFENVKPHIPPITRAYVDRVLANRDRFGSLLTTPSE